jgi:tRNA(Ile)-lysidine synthetase-like protein
MRINTELLPNDRFYVLVSGGVDSISIAHWLKHSFRKSFKVIHFNHNVQPINKQMVESVNRFCADNDIECLNFFNTEFSRFTQKDLREWRLSVMDSLTGDFVTGHHLNDAVENYIANCLSGTPEYKPIEEISDFPNFSIYHPFITIPKRDMTEYVEKNDLQRYIVEDPSNANTKYRRNWIRNTLLQEIYNRDIGIESVVRRKFYNYE